jgi:hypothetical protein
VRQEQRRRRWQRRSGSGHSSHSSTNHTDSLRPQHQQEARFDDHEGPPLATARAYRG